jgi:NADH-quinone oxidoreductase subunit N
VLALAMSVVSLYYYLKVLKAAYVSPAPLAAYDLKPEWIGTTVLVLIAAGVVILGVLPGVLLGPLAEAIGAAALAVN